ncbi:MAG: RNA polymerase sigma factor [Chloroflexi bacterium]|nr:RNA polymerase sigma factor [Chloroflexota bacterium]
MKLQAAAARTNTGWLADLHDAGERREQALADLRGIILSGLPYALANWVSPSNPQFEELAEDVVQETLLRVLDNLSSFEQRSHFTTWAHKIAVRVALTELRRRRWKDTSLDALMEVQGDSMPMASSASPARTVEQNDIVRRVERIIAEELTDKQRTALMAVNVHGMPLEEVAWRMGTNRNALYKLLHDARRRIKSALQREHLTAHDVLSAFAEG